jgi:hypothetical protein
MVRQLRPRCFIRTDSGETRTLDQFCELPPTQRAVTAQTATVGDQLVPLSCMCSAASNLPVMHAISRRGGVAGEAGNAQQRLCM